MLLAVQLYAAPSCLTGGVYHQVNTLLTTYYNITTLRAWGNHGVTREVSFGVNHDHVGFGVNRDVSFEANPEVECVGCQTSSGG